MKRGLSNMFLKPSSNFNKYFWLSSTSYKHIIDLLRLNHKVLEMNLVRKKLIGTTEIQDGIDYFKVYESFYLL